MLLNNQRVNDEIQEEIQKYPDTNENGTRISSSKGKFRGIKAYLRKNAKYLTLHWKELKKEEQTKPKIRRKKIIKISGNNTNNKN